MPHRHATALLVALLAAALTGCSVATASDSVHVVRGDVDGDAVRIDMPDGDPIATAIWFHGQGGDADYRMGGEWLESLRAAGWAVVGADLHGNHWGSADATAEVAALVEYAAEKTSAEVRLFVAGSMGALPSLNSMIRGQDVGCWYGTMPVLDQRTVANVPNSEDEIAAAWGRAVPQDYIPAKNLADLPLGTNYRILVSEDDTWVPARKNGDLLLSVPGITISVGAATGEHGDPSHFDAEDLAAFAATCS